jgi:hypothetical protein
MKLKVWEIHPQASKIEHAEKTCMGSANKAAVQWCGPYVNANQSGFWVHPPIDMDFVFNGESFDILNMEDFGGQDFDIVKSLVRPEDNSSFEKWCFPGTGRTKMTFGLVEKNVMQMWTGLIFQTPPGWCLHIRSPINFPNEGFNIVEAVLETDWMQYDIWMNLSVNEINKKISIRKENPIAHLVPMRRESFKGEWEVERNRIGRDTKESEEVLKYWLGYNKQKFEFGGRQALGENLTKDATTYFKERSRLIGKEMEPYGEVEKCPEEKPASKCPYAHLHAQVEQKESPIFEPLRTNFMDKRFLGKN